PAQFRKPKFHLLKTANSTTVLARGVLTVTWRHGGPAPFIVAIAAARVSRAIAPLRNAGALGAVSATFAVSVAHTSAGRTRRSGLGPPETGQRHASKA